MTYDTLFETELMKLADAELIRQHEVLANMQAVPTYADYANRICLIAALRDILPRMCDEVNTILAKR